MQLKELSPDIEMHGGMAKAVLEGFDRFKLLASSYLIKQGIGRFDEDGNFDIAPDAWYPLVSWLTALFAIEQAIGDKRLFEIGANVVRAAKLAPGTPDVPSVLQGLNVTVHLNQRLHGRVMYDVETKAFTPGIGGYELADLREHRARVVCSTPFPCSWTRGVIFGQIQRFSPTAEVRHDDGAPCRKTGAPSCTYLVRW